MTADVSFTDLARAGRQAGLEVLHFGPERDVTGDDLSQLLPAAADCEPVAMFLGNPVFKVLVLGARPTDVFTGPLMSSLPLSSREQDVPKTRRPRSRTSRRPSPPSDRKRRPRLRARQQYVLEPSRAQLHICEGKFPCVLCWKRIGTGFYIIFSAAL